MTTIWITTADKWEKIPTTMSGTEALAVAKSIYACLPSGSFVEVFRNGKGIGGFGRPTVTIRR